jgi:hypothetical protein
MNAMDEISVYALLLHFGLVVFADTALIGTFFRFVVSFGFELTGAMLRGIHAGGIFSCMSLVSILAPASLPDVVRSKKGVGKNAKPLRERFGPAVQPCGYISDDAVYRLKTVFLFMSASLFL